MDSPLVTIDMAAAKFSPARRNESGTIEIPTAMRNVHVVPSSPQSSTLFSRSTAEGLLVNYAKGAIKVRQTLPSLPNQILSRRSLLRLHLAAVLELHLLVPCIVRDPASAIPISPRCCMHRRSVLLQDFDGTTAESGDGRYIVSLFAAIVST